MPDLDDMPDPRAVAHIDQFRAQGDSNLDELIEAIRAMGDPAGTHPYLITAKVLEGTEHSKLTTIATAAVMRLAAQP